MGTRHGVPGAPDVFPALRGVGVDVLRDVDPAGSSPAATIDGRSMFVARPVKAFVRTTSSIELVTSISLYAGGAMLSVVAMKRVPM